MDTLKRLIISLLVGALAGACSGKVAGLSDNLAPLATLHVQLAPGTDVTDLKHPRVGLVWAGQTVVESFCWTATLSADPKVRAVADAGCRDPLGFYPNHVGVSAPLRPDGTADLSIQALPAADLLVGDLSARIAYASVVLYDDGDADDTLSLRNPHWLHRHDDDPLSSEGGGPGEDGKGGPGGREPDEEDETADRDVLHAASLRSMTQPDVRVAFREGGFDALSAYYPREGCPPPPIGYSLVGAAGFSILDAILAFAKGKLPATTGCTTTTLALDAVVLARAATRTVQGVGCRRGNTANANGTPRYREAPAKGAFLDELPWVCRPVGSAGLGALGGLLGGADASSGGKADGQGRPGSGSGSDKAAVDASEELIVAYAETSCPALRHYTLRGCRNDPNCEIPQWNLSGSPPDWWPCKVVGASGATTP